MEILVVEENPLILKTMGFYLKKEGYDVSTSMDGKDAIRKIEMELPDLVITEILLPSVGGLEIINFVKHINKKKIPVIVLSKLGLEKHITEAFETGADDYITKPFGPEELIYRIKRLSGKSDNTIKETNINKTNLLYYIVQKMISKQQGFGDDYIGINEMMNYPTIKNNYSREDVLMILNEYSGIFSVLNLGADNKFYRLA